MPTTFKIYARVAWLDPIKLHFKPCDLEIKTCCRILNGLTLKNVTEEFQMLADPTLISLNIIKVIFKFSKYFKGTT